MRQATVLVALLALAGCDTPEKRLKAAEDRRDLMEKSGASKSELCAEGEKVFQASLDTKDPSTVQIARIERDNACAAVRLEALGFLPAHDPAADAQIDRDLDEAANAADAAVERASENQAEFLKSEAE